MIHFKSSSKAKVLSPDKLFSSLGAAAGGIVGGVIAGLIASIFFARRNFRPCKASFEILLVLQYVFALRLRPKAMCIFIKGHHNDTHNASQEPTLPSALESATASEQTAELVSVAPVSRIPNAPVLKDYIIVGQLGRGRSVWLAEETASGLRGRVVVRVGRPDAPAGPLLREIESLARVKSDHVASYRHCLLAADGARAVVFEYVEGEQLSKILARQADGRLPWRAPQPAGGERGGSSSEMSASGVIMGVLRGLAALHTAQIVHGGLTPANILVRNGRAVLTDLRKSALSGRSSSAGEDPGSSAHAEEAGSYLSPEQVQPEEAVASEGIDARVDVWAAGVVLHEMLTGCPLFQVGPILLSLKCI
jgi:hypothetical protein